MKLKENQDINWRLCRRLLSLFILVFEGFGIRVLDGVIPSPIIFWTGLLLLLNIKQIQKLPIMYWMMLLLICAFYTIFSFIKGLQPQVFLYAAWLSAFCVLSNYINKSKRFINDLFYFTKYCVYYNIAHLVALVILYVLLTKTNFGMKPSTILYVFYYNSEESILGIPRIQGFCWEPSCWNCLLNLNIALTLAMKKPWKELILPIISIVSVFSTTGFATMLVIFGSYFLCYNKKVSWTYKITVFLLAAIVFPIAQDNISHKLKTGSGATRYGDFFVASYVIRQSPLLGDDLDNITKNMRAMKAKEKNWGIYGDVNVYSDVGMTNAFAGLFVEYGLIIPIILFLLFYLSPIFPNKETAILVEVCMLFMLMGTPIARTGFFYMFPFSTIFFLKIRKSKK